MRSFMDLVQDAFLSGSNWNVDNSYGSLTSTSKALLDFPIPSGIHLHVSSLTTPHLATSYTLSSAGRVDGSLSYLYSSSALPLPAQVARTSSIPLRLTVPSYRPLLPYPPAPPSWHFERFLGGRRIDRLPTLLYGRMFLPSSTLEALYLRRLRPKMQLKISTVSGERLKNHGTILALLQRDEGKWSAEGLFSTDSALVGARGLWNFGPDPRHNADHHHERTEPTGPSASEESLSPTAALASRSERSARLSLGGEVYYGLANKSGGMSTGLRFTTLQGHQGFPLTMTATLNPLMGNLSASYAVKAGTDLALAARFDFNVYSYESGVVLGCELWRRKETGGRESIQAESSANERDDSGYTSASSSESKKDDDGIQGVLKSRIDQSGDIGILWEGRIKDLLFSLGTSIDLRSRTQPIRAFGVEFQYSS
ncbi:MAG: Mitochondrial distribution and morphology protein 10 [Vezdaea aestivalis]|nr:MAG: Mitochondrial distribution and morphology protein 10 [Vezdaea aestivalis]